MTPTARPDIHATYGFHQTPFTRELRTSARFAQPEHDAVVARLRRVVDERLSGALIAPAGTGKSVILRALIDELPEARYRVYYLHVVSLSKRDFARHLARAIGAKTAGHAGALVNSIQEHAAALVAQDALRPVIIIDEAHEFRPEVLGLLRLLTNFEVDSKLVISVILAGQPPLRRLLRRDDMAAVRGRLSYVGTLRTLTREESHAYVRYRAELAGAPKPVFDQHALDAIYEVAQGNLRALNAIALSTLYAAAEQGAEVCGTEHVIQARKEML